MLGTYLLRWTSHETHTGGPRARSDGWELTRGNGRFPPVESFYVYYSKVLIYSRILNTLGTLLETDMVFSLGIAYCGSVGSPGRETIQKQDKWSDLR